MSPERAAIALDIGGTFLKGAVFDRAGRDVRGSLCTVPVDSAGPREQMLAAYAHTVSRALAAAGSSGIEVAGIGIATPGPFDFAGGRSLMQHKFQAIHGLELRPELRRRCALGPELPIRFLHDVHAFISGEILRGAAQGHARVAGVTIGTGVGFGCIVEGRFLDNGAGSPHLALYKQPWGDGIVEDVVSRRGIIAGFRARSGREEDLDVVDIASLARDRGDPHAREAFRQVARVLAECLYGILVESEIECLVMGGQISKAYDLMRADLGALLGRVPTLRRVCQARSVDLAALYGAARAALEP